jgi:hypothetical protein
MGVFHGIIGVIAFIAYALPFMFVKGLRPYRNQALSIASIPDSFEND